MFFARKEKLFFNTAIFCAFFSTSFALGAEAAQKDPSVKVSVDASLSEDDSTLDGSVSIELSNDTGAPIESLPLWLYPNRFREINGSIDDRTVHWLYPAGESAGKMEISEPVWNGSRLPKKSVELEKLPAPGSPADAANVMARIKLPKKLAPGESGSLSLRFKVVIPERRGRFGRWRGTAMLGGGWFPQPMTDLTGRNCEAPPDSILAKVSLTLPAGRGAVIHDRIFLPSEKSRTVSADGIRSEAVAVVIMDRMEVTEKSLPFGKAYYISRQIRKRSPDWEDTRSRENGVPEGLPRSGTVDAHKRALDVVEAAARIVREISADAPLPERLVLVEVPAWDRLVQPGPGPVLVSDRIWRLAAIEQFLWFHDLALVREVGAALAWPAARRTEPPEQRFIAADLVGVYLAKRYSVEIHKGKKSVTDLIGFAGFLPTVDNLLYAPENPFREVYSQSIEDDDRLRDQPWRFMNRQPFGKRILAKIEDLFGEKETDKFIVEFLSAQSGVEASIEKRLGKEASRFFGQWYGDYPKVNYRLGAIEEIDLDGGKVRHRVEVVRDGANILEPVTVRLKDEDGSLTDLVWRGDGRSGFVEWISSAPLEQAEIDPKNRLVESPDLTADHPSADNLDPLPWRQPLINRLIFWGDALKGEPYVQLGLTMRRKYDITNSFSLLADITPKGFGGTLVYYRNFGPKRTLNARTWYLGPLLGADRYYAVDDAGMGKMPDDLLRGAAMGSIGFTIGRDDRTNFWDPRSGSSFWVIADYATGRTDHDRSINVGRATARASVLFSPFVRHTFALFAGALGLVGDPVAANLATLSDRQILRGFEIDETYGRAGLYGLIEYRHTIVDASGVSIPPASWFDRFQGVLFAGAGTISRPDGYSGIFSGERIFTEAGYGLRLHTLALGSAQYLLCLDLAVPITPLDRTVESERNDRSAKSRDRAPFRLIFGVTQTF